MKLAAALLIVVVAAACGPKASPPGSSPPTAGCVVGGCSGTVCAAADAEPTMTTCEWRDEYACYRDATCERQADGACGWTESDALTACLASPPAAE